MPVPARVRAVLPKQPVIDAKYSEARIRAWLKDVGEQFRTAMKFYPPIQPWKHGFPKTGPRAGGKRTGLYGKGWDSPLIITPFSVRLENSVPYARYVGGPNRARGGRARQARHLKARGWPSQSDVASTVRKKNLPRLRKLILPVRNP